MPRLERNRRSKDREELDEYIREEQAQARADIKRLDPHGFWEEIRKMRDKRNRLMRKRWNSRDAIEVSELNIEIDELSKLIDMTQDAFHRTLESDK